MFCLVVGRPTIYIRAYANSTCSSGIIWLLLQSQYLAYEVTSLQYFYYFSNFKLKIKSLFSIEQQMTSLNSLHEQNSSAYLPLSN